MSDSEGVRKALQGYLGSVKDPTTGANIADPKTAGTRVAVRRYFRYTKAQDAATGTPVAEVPIWNPLVACTILRITFTPDSTLATAGTNYMTVTLQKRTAASSYVTTAAVGTFTTNTGGQAFTQWTPVAVGAANMPVSFVPNDILTYTNAKTGTGSQLPGGVFEIEYEESY